MHYRRLGASGMQVSAICLGTAFYGSLTPVDEALRLVHRALDLGINFIDTANTYGDRRFSYPGVPADRPMVEEIVGQALRSRRGEVILATKCGEPVGQGPNARGLARRHIMEQVEISLRRLGTDYLDLYYPHHPDPLTPIEETLRAFDDLVRQGKVRYVGLSDHRAWQVVKALWTADERRLTSPVCVQTLYHLLDRRDEAELLPTCRQFGLSMVIFSPLAGGLLAGTYRPGEPPPAGSRGQVTHADRGRPSSIPLLTAAALSAAQRVAKIAGERGQRPGPLALAWLLSHPEVGAVISGTSTVAELEENVAAIDLPFSAEDRAALDALPPW
jgi:aryl-alcohol dehydrogenase-like predicted oxidoreductase